MLEKRSGKQMNNISWSNISKKVELGVEWDFSKGWTSSVKCSTLDKCWDQFIMYFKLDIYEKKLWQVKSTTE